MSPGKPDLACLNDTWIAHLPSKPISLPSATCKVQTDGKYIFQWKFEDCKKYHVSITETESWELVSIYIGETPEIEITLNDNEPRRDEIEYHPKVTLRTNQKYSIIIRDGDTKGGYQRIYSRGHLFQFIDGQVINLDYPEDKLISVTNMTVNSNLQTFSLIWAPIINSVYIVEVRAQYEIKNNKRRSTTTNIDEPTFSETPFVTVIGNFKDYSISKTKKELKELVFARNSNVTFSRIKRAREIEKEVHAYKFRVSVSGPVLNWNTSDWINCDGAIEIVDMPGSQGYVDLNSIDGRKSIVSEDEVIEEEIIEEVVLESAGLVAPPQNGFEDSSIAFTESNEISKVYC